MLKKIVLFLLVAYAITGFIALPYFVKPQLIQIIEQETNSKISIDSISFNPFIFKLKISDIELKTLDNEHLISLGYILVDVELYSLFNSTIHVKEMTLREPSISLVYNKDKTFNILSIVKESNTTTAESNSSVEIPRIKVDKISIVEGSIAYEDFTQKSKFDFSFNHIGFSLKDIDTHDFNSSSAELRFYSTLGDGGFVDLKSKIVGFEPLTLTGSLGFEASKLYTEWRYMRDSLNLEVADGKLSFYGEYYFNIDDLNATSVHNARMSLDGLRIKPKDKHRDVLNLDSFYVQNVTLKPMQKSVHIDKVGFDSLYVKAVRDSAGNIDWIEYIKVNTAEVNSSVEEIEEVVEESVPWSVVLDNLALQKIKVDFLDNAITPTVNTRLNEFNLYAQNITLAGIEPIKYQVDTLLNDKFKCSIDGDIVHSKLNINSSLKCSGFDLIHYRPYIDKAAKDALDVYNVKLIRAKVGFGAEVNLQDINDEIVVDVTDTNLRVDKLVINKRSNGKRVLSFGAFGVKGLALNTKAKLLNISQVVLSGLDIKAARLEDGTINLDGLVVPKKSEEVKKSKAKEEKDYRVKLKHLSLNYARVRFDDKTLDPSVESKLDGIYFSAYDIDSKRGTWLSYAFEGRVNAKGYIKSKGSLRHTPIKQKGTFELEKISLVELNPYIQEKAYLELMDGFLSIKSKTEYSVSATNADLRVTGSFALNELFVNDSRNQAPILSFNEVGLKSFTLEAMPNRLHINEANIDGFYVDALIDEKKVLNFSLLTKNDNNQSIEEIETKNIDTNTTDVNASQNTFPIRLDKLSINMGSAKFADLSLPIKFKTHIHDLNGVIYSISNTPGETTLMDIIGEIDKYGAMKLKGSLNSSNPKAFTDLDLSFSNLELNSFSGYSASFAGHEIESGKLYLDLGYDVLNSDIKGSNSIIIKQMKLGREIEDENITSIPLGFIIGLLEDSDGVIDIDMPVEGNIDEPDFKYGTLIFKTFTNLLWKAVTSPFSFLGSMMGIDGDTLTYAEFEAGKTNILPPEREKLDQIVKMMIKKPKISLGVAGRYDEKLDTRALKIEKLISLVVKKSGIKNRDEHESAMTDDMLEDIYKEVRDDNRLEKIEDDLEKKYKAEELERVYHMALIEEAIDVQVVMPKELSTLGQSRAQMMKNYLVLEKNIDASRVNLLNVKNVDESSEKYVRIKLEVEVK